MRQCENMRITFLGDIIISKEQLASHKTDAGYDFSAVSDALSGAFDDSDYVIANLETPVAGEQLGYTDAEYSFNTPASLLKAIKDSGIDMLQTANNHCLDRGIDGLKNTMNAISGNGLEYIGTHLNREDSFKIVNIRGISVGILAFTYGTNAFDNGCYLDKGDSYLVDLLQKQELSGSFERMIYSADNRVKRVSKKLLGKIDPERYDAPVYERPEPCKEERLRLHDQILRCRESGAEFVIVLLHVGGQFNPEPSEFTIEICDFCRDCGADLIIANHEHLIHPFDYGDSFCWYSLGNFLSSDGVLNPPFDNLCQYSAVVHADLTKKENLIIPEYGFELFCNHKDGNGRVVTESAYNLYERCEDEAAREKIRQECEVLLNKIFGTHGLSYGICRYYGIGSIKEKNDRG